MQQQQQQQQTQQGGAAAGGGSSSGGSVVPIAAVAVSQGGEKGGHAADPYQGQARYEAYKADVDTVLQSFDKAKEWADLIKCLERLAKTFGRYPQFPRSVPFKLLLSKRLAQCLNPSLPSGVHRKTLELYNLIFTRLGREGLSNDLPLYSAGLFPLFQYASMQVRPKIMGLVRDHYLHLGKALCSCLPGLVLSLLPGLEEEGTEFYEKVIELLDSVCDNSQRASFFAAIWKAMLASSYARIPAVNYLMARLPSKRVLLSDNRNLMEEYFPNCNAVVLPAMIAALADDSVLRLRMTLELLVQHLSLEIGLFKEHALSDLVRAVLKVLTRRDMSLNRRIYAWLLGTTEDLTSSTSGIPSKEEGQYFSQHAKAATVAALKKCLAEPPTDSASAMRPYKMLTSLLDKGEIGWQIVEDILVDVLVSFHVYGKGHTFSNETTQSVSLILEQLQPEVVWACLEMLIKLQFSATREAAPPLSQIPSGIKPLSIVRDALELLTIKELVQKGAVYSLLRCAFTELFLSLPTPLSKMDQQAEECCLETLQLCFNVLSNLADAISDGAVDEHSVAFMIGNKLGEKTKNQENGSLVEEANVANITMNDAFQAFTQLFSSLTAGYLDNSTYILSHNQKDILLCLFDLFSKLQFEPLPTVEDLASAPSEQPQWLSILLSCCRSVDPEICCCAINGFRGICRTIQKQIHGLPTWTHQACQQIALQLWKLLEATNVSVHGQVADSLFCLYGIDSTIVNGIITGGLLHSCTEERVLAIRKMNMLWRLAVEGEWDCQIFSSHLPLLLDALSVEQHPAIQLAGKTWLNQSLAQLSRILDPLLAVLMTTETSRYCGVYQQIYDTRRVLHTFSTLRTLIESDSRLFMAHACDTAPSVFAIYLNDQQLLSAPFTAIEKPSPASTSSNVEILYNPRLEQQQKLEEKRKYVKEEHVFGVSNYIDLLALVAWRFVEGRVPNTAAPDFRENNEMVRAAAANFLNFMIPRVTPLSFALSLSRVLQEHILKILAECISASHAVLQVHLLSIVKVIIRLQAQAHSRNSRTFVNSTGTRLSPSRRGSREDTFAVDVEEEWMLGSSPMFLQCMASGLLQRPSLEQGCLNVYWMDVLTSALPYLSRRQLYTLVSPVLNCLCQVLPSSIYPISAVSAHTLLAVLKSIHVVLRFSLYPTGPHHPNSSGTVPTEQHTSTASNAGSLPVRLFTDFVKDVFHTEEEREDVHRHLQHSHKDSFSNKQIQDDIFDSVLPTLLKALLLQWQSTSLRQTEARSALIVRAQLVEIMKPLVSQYSVRLVHSLIALWENESEAFINSASLCCSPSTLISFWQDKLFSVPVQLFNTMDPPVFSVIVAAFEAAVTSNGTTNTADATTASIHTDKEANGCKDKGILRWNSHDLALFYLKYYVGHCALKGEDVEKGWLGIISFLKHALNAHKPSLVLSLLDMLAEHLQHIPTISLHRPLKELLYHVVEVLMPLTSKSFLAKLRLQGLESPLALAAVILDNSASSLLPSPEKLALAFQIKALRSVAKVLLPMMHVVLGDKPDQSLSLLTSINGTILPMLRDIREEWETKELAAHTLEIQCQLFSSIARRTWRRDVTDFFNDADFFNMPYSAVPSWCSIISYIMVNDSSAWDEITKALTRATTPQTAAMIFVNKDLEIKNRALQLQRLAFVLYGGHLDQYCQSVKLIMERLAEAIKLGKSAIVLRKALLCMRVLLLRFSANRLRSFWPVILTELFRIFRSNNRRGGEIDVHVKLDACKFVDLALLLRIDDFNLHDWMFFTGPLKDTVVSPTYGHETKDGLSYQQGRKRGPILTAHTDSFADLGIAQQHIQHFWNTALENTLSSGEVDFESVHDVMRMDLVAFFSPEQQQLESGASTPLETEWVNMLIVE